MVNLLRTFRLHSIYLKFHLWIHEIWFKIQDDNLSGDASSVDISTEENLDNLVRIGEQLLDKRVSSVNLDTGRYEPVGNETNREALKR